jgi:hypothetical protein
MLISYIYLFAIFGAIVSDYRWSIMILSNRVNRVAELKGYRFNLLIVYIIWPALVLLLSPCCKWFDCYKRNKQSAKNWLTCL